MRFLRNYHRLTEVGNMWRASLSTQGGVFPFAAFLLLEKCHLLKSSTRSRVQSMVGERPTDASLRNMPRLAVSQTRPMTAPAISRLRYTFWGPEYMA